MSKTIYLASTDFGIIEAKASKVTAKQAVIQRCPGMSFIATLPRDYATTTAPKHMVPGFFDTRKEAEDALRTRLAEDYAKAEEAFCEALAARTRASERVRRMTVGQSFRMVPIQSIGYDAGPGPIDGVNDALEERLEEGVEP